MGTLLSADVCRRGGRVLAAAGLCLLAGAAEAQSVRRQPLAPPRAIANVGRAPALGSAEVRAIVEDKRGRITSHHLDVPVAESPAAFATEIWNDPFVAGRRTRSAGFGTGVRVLDLRPVSEAARQSAGIEVKDYYRSASTIAEPSLAVRGDEILVTANWYAAMSLDGGRTFRMLDPYQAFGAPPLGAGFCCDQVAAYDRASDTMFWLLQGSRNADGNSFRLLVARGADDIRNQRWKVYDLPVTLVAEAGRVWFDFPDIGLTDGHLFITSNIFTLPTATKPIVWEAATVMRLPTARLAAYETVSAETWTTSEASTIRLAQGDRGRDRMYFASHRDTARFMLRSWADAEAEVSAARTIRVERWVNPRRDVLTNSNAKNGKPWLWRANGRILAGWDTPEHLGFAWNAAEDERFPTAHVRVALVEKSALAGPPGDLPLAASAEPHIWAEHKSIAYPAASVNSRGDVAVSVAFAGREYMPSYAVGVLVPSDRQELPPPAAASETPPASPPASPPAGADRWAWGFTIVAEGRNTPPCADLTAPRCGVWGDYFALRPHGQFPATWAGVGYALQDSQPTEVSRPESVYVWFGHKQSIAGDLPPGMPLARAPAPRPPGADGPAIETARASARTR